MRFKGTTADEICVFIGFEVGQPNNYGMWRKGGGNRRDSLGKLAYKKVYGVGISSRRGINLIPDVLRDLVTVEQGLGMNTNSVIDNKL